MKKPAKQPKTIKLLADNSASGKNKRLPKKPTDYIWLKGTSMFHN